MLASQRHPLKILFGLYVSAHSQTVWQTREIETENETDEIDAGVAKFLPMFADGKKTDDDLPAILSVGVSYAWLDWMGVEKDFFGHPRFAEWKKR